MERSLVSRFRSEGSGGAGTWSALLCPGSVPRAQVGLEHGALSCVQVPFRGLLWGSSLEHEVLSRVQALPCCTHGAVLKYQ